MPRDNYNDTIISVDTEGAPTVLIEGILVTVYVGGTTDLATIYVARTGSAQITNPFEAPNGKVNLWADSGEYDVLYHDMTTPVRISDQVYGWEAISAAVEGVPGALVARSSLTSDRAAADLLNMLIPTGTVLSFAGTVAPTGFSLCNGASLLRTAFPALFAVIGTTYGSVDGTHFNLPDLLGRVVVGAGNGSGLNAKPLAVKSGVESVALTTAQMPTHRHGGATGTGATGGGTSGSHDVAHGHTIPGSGGMAVTDASLTAANIYPAVQVSGATAIAPGHTPALLANAVQRWGAVNAATAPHQHSVPALSVPALAINNEGGGGTHDNMMPYTALNAIIRNGT
jgi:microcystin-dependent protein